jgi:pimeloyl-ACP methyl ester carboxylesterase
MANIRHVKIHHYPSLNGQRAHPPLVFVHGGYIEAAYWAVNFIPYFQAQGYDCHAMDLAGHGQSDGKRCIDQYGLDDYAQDVRLTVQSLERPPIIIGHSMGCVVTQRFLQQYPNQTQAAVFIAPVPPSGTGLSAFRLAMLIPDFFTELNRFFEGCPPTERTLSIVAKTYFSPDTDRQVILHTLPLIQPESNKAITEMATLPMPLSFVKPKLPVLFMGGSEDAVFSSALLPITALSWPSSTVSIIARAGHMLMLDPQWQMAAEQIKQWIQAMPFAA